MTSEGFDSPEMAAMSTFPPQYCRAIASRMSEDEAYVVLNTGTREQPYLYGVHCHRRGGRWYEGNSGNGGGWQQTGHDPDVGTLTMWDNAPVEVTSVRIQFDGDVIEEPVTEGAYLHVWWQVPCPSEWPHVVAVRLNDRWEAESGVGLFMRAAAARASNRSR
jgi:hypothetical protein